MKKLLIATGALLIATNAHALSADSEKRAVQFGTVVGALTSNNCTALVPYLDAEKVDVMVLATKVSDAFNTAYERGFSVATIAFEDKSRSKDELCKVIYGNAFEAQIIK